MAADYKKLKEGIASAIKSNGAGEITGDILQEQMLNVVDTLNAGKAEAADLADIKADVAKLKVMVETGAGGGGEGGGGLIIVDDKETLEALEVPMGTIASVVNDGSVSLSAMYDYLADGGSLDSVDYTQLDTVRDVKCKFPEMSVWPRGYMYLLGTNDSESTRYYFSSNTTQVLFRYVLNGELQPFILAENNSGVITINDEAIRQMHEVLRSVPDLRYIGVQDGNIADMSQFFEIIIEEAQADAYILGETWQRLMKDGEMPEIDLSALAQKADLDTLTEAVVENEEVTAAALNDLNTRVNDSATKGDIQTINDAFANYPTKTEIAESLESLTTYVDEAISEAITNTLNTAV